MALPPERFTLIEGDLYAWKLSRLGDAEDVDLALTDLLWALARIAPRTVCWKPARSGCARSPPRRCSVTMARSSC